MASDQCSSCWPSLETTSWSSLLLTASPPHSLLADGSYVISSACWLKVGIYQNAAFALFCLLSTFSSLKISSFPDLYSWRKSPRPLSIPGHPPPPVPELSPIYLMNISTTWMSSRYFKHSNLKCNWSLALSKAVTIQLDCRKRNTSIGTGRLSSYGDR